MAEEWTLIGGVPGRSSSTLGAPGHPVGPGKPRPALIRWLLFTRLGVGPVKGQGLKIQLFTLMEQSSAKGEGRKV